MSEGFIEQYALTEVIEDAVERYKRNWYLDEKRLEEIMQDIEVIDNFLIFNCNSVEVEVNENTLDLVVNLYCGDFVVKDEVNFQYPDVIKNTSYFGFAYASDVEIKVVFGFSGLFRRKV